MDKMEVWYRLTRSLMAERCLTLKKMFKIADYRIKAEQLANAPEQPATEYGAEARRTACIAILQGIGKDYPEEQEELEKPAEADKKPEKRNSALKEVLKKRFSNEGADAIRETADSIYEAYSTNPDHGEMPHAVEEIADLLCEIADEVKNEEEEE